METLDFRKQYEAMTNEELLNLAMDSEQLNPEARNWLDSELSRRGIGRGKIHVLRCCLRPSLTEVPFLRRSYPVSSVLRTSPPPHTARPVSHELPVDPY